MLKVKVEGYVGAAQVGILGFWEISGRWVLGVLEVIQREWFWSFMGKSKICRKYYAKIRSSKFRK